jgi:hypothetical protein
MSRPYKSTPVTGVKVGDTIIFNQPRYDVTVERTSATVDGWIGLHANDDTWSLYLKPADTARVLTPTT